MYVVNLELGLRLERSEAAHWGSLMEGLAPDYGASVDRFGTVVALSCPGMADRPFVNRVMCAGPADLADLERAVAHLRSREVPVRVDVSPLASNEEMFEWLDRNGLRHMGFQAALFGEPAVEQAALPPGIEICPIRTEDEMEFAANAVSVVFESHEAPWPRWLADSFRATVGRPDWRNYIAYSGGAPAGFAQLHTADGVGSLALAGTLPQFRGRGVQSALIRRRIADARAAGCDLIAAQTGNGTVSQHNMERLGLRVAYTKAEFCC